MDFTRNFAFYQNPKTLRELKRLLKKWTLRIKTTNEPEQKFWKT